MGHLLNFFAGPSLALLFQLGIQGRESLAASCAARNIVANGGFETDISSWTPPARFGSAQWVMGGAGSETSGSLRLINNSAPSAQTVSVSQCSVIQGGTSYDLGAKIHPVNFCCLPGAKQPLAVRHTGALYVLLNFYPKPACAGVPLNDYVRLDSEGRNDWQALAQTFRAPSSAVSVQTTLAIFKAEAGDDLKGNFDEISIAPSGQADPSALCLGGRFKVQTDWSTSAGQSGAGKPVALTSDTGYFSFFDPKNVEMVVKVLNGCGLNSKYWVFAGGLTDVRVGMTITDTVTGTVRTYSNPMGTPFSPIQDTEAFGTCASPTAVSERASETIPSPPDSIAEPGLPDGPARSRALAETACVANPTTLCLNNSRFAVTARWTTATGQTGAARMTSLTDESGYFWFFDPGNVEMIVKVLNGCGLDSSYWVFTAGLTNVEVVVTVTDMLTGTVKTYTNPQGQAFRPIQDTSAFATCP